MCTQNAWFKVIQKSKSAKPRRNAFVAQGKVSFLDSWEQNDIRSDGDFRRASN